jgi:TPR repeat protein
MTALAYEGEILDRDESKYVYYLKEAADLGHQGAQGTLGLAYNRQKEDKTSLHYITLAASQGDPKACGTLGSYFLNAECGLSKSLILAKHYSEKSLEDDEEYEPLFACNFSLALLQSHHQQHHPRSY